MPDWTSLVNVWELAKPATTLIEKISDAIWVLYEPTHVERMAKAEAKAEQIKELSRIETGTLKYRAIQRFMSEETGKQQNIEDIIGEAIPLLNEGAKPENIEKDWISNFFDKSKLTSDEEMRKLWSSILADEANNPWKFSKRTVNFVADLDKKDAELFTKLCWFNFQIGSIQPLIFDPQAEIYTKNWINFWTLKHLDAIWLISFDSISWYVLQKIQKTIIVQYQQRPLKITCQSDIDNSLPIWKVLLTETGKQLATICNPVPVDWIIEYSIEQLAKENIILEKILST